MIVLKIASVNCALYPSDYGVAILSGFLFTFNSFYSRVNLVFTVKKQHDDVVVYSVGLLLVVKADYVDRIFSIGGQSMTIANSVVDSQGNIIIGGYTSGTSITVYDLNGQAQLLQLLLTLPIADLL
ncbi:hypothetical protein MP228_012753 [Amoeboaphelidium protococcarum]|nr:hypothetical protein MP228_012753 [Amoeboaphelidium protococcarum]